MKIPIPLTKTPHQMKQLFSRDSSKKSSKVEKEVQRTRVLKSPEQSESGYRRYRDPEPSDDDRRRSDREDGDRWVLEGSVGLPPPNISN